jgi:hypothetical protein
LLERSVLKLKWTTFFDEFQNSENQHMPLCPGVPLRPKSSIKYKLLAPLRPKSMIKYELLAPLKPKSTIKYEFVAPLTPKSTI